MIIAFVHMRSCRCTVRVHVQVHVCALKILMYMYFDLLQAVWYLLHGALAGHRLCHLSLGNKHTHGLDAVPADLEIAYGELVPFK